MHLFSISDMRAGQIFENPGLPLDYVSILWGRWLSFLLPSVLSWFDPRCSESRSDVQPFSDRLSRCTKSLGYPCHLPVFNFTNISWVVFSTMGTLFITKLFCYNKSQRACVTFGIKRCHMNQLKNTTASYKCWKSIYNIAVRKPYSTTHKMLMKLTPARGQFQ